MRSLPTALLLLLLTSCSSDPDATEVRVRLSPPDDTSCIGVSGFELEVTVGNGQPAKSTSMRSRPVLARDDCDLQSPVSLQDVDFDAPVLIVLRGFDGAKRQRVQGMLQIARLRDAGTQTLTVKGVDSSPLQVVAIDRSSVLKSEPIGSVTSLELSGQSGASFAVDAKSAGAWFAVGEPWAAAISPPFPTPLAAGDDITVRAILTKGVSSAHCVLQNKGDYLLAVVQ